VSRRGSFPSSVGGAGFFQLTIRRHAARSRFLCLFFAPPGLRPGLGRLNPPFARELFLLVWLNFRIYFESGIAKLLSHDPQWRGLTAMDQYYQKGPLPTWIGWYAHNLLTVSRGNVV